MEGAYSAGVWGGRKGVAGWTGRTDGAACFRVTMVMSPDWLLAVITFRAEGDRGTDTVVLPKESRVWTR